MNYLREYKMILSNKMDTHVQISLYIHAIIKCHFKKFSSKNYEFFITLLTLIASPTVYIIIIILRIYRYAVQRYLKFKLGDNFFSLLDGSEVVFQIDESKHSRSVIIILLLVEYNDNDFFEKAKREIINIFSKPKFQKLRCTREYCMGYYYYKKHYECLENFVKFLPMAKNLDELQKAISLVANQPMPLEDKGMWDVFIGKTGIKKGDEKLEFPIIFRIHHCVGDAVTVFNMFSREFAHQKRTVIIKDEPKRHASNSTKFNDAFIKYFPTAAEPDHSILCGLPISGNKHLIWFSDSSRKYLDMIKSIKNKLGRDYTFVDVVLTAFSATLTDFLKKHTNSFPKIATCITAIFPTNYQFKNYGLDEDYTFDNKFSLIFMKLPLKKTTETSEFNVLEQLKLIHQEYMILKRKSLDIPCNRWQGRVVLTVLPAYFANKFLKFNASSALFSNIPGCNSLKFFGDSRVSEFVIFDPNVSTSGISLMVTTYEDRLNIALTLDKAIVQDLQDAKNMCSCLIRTIEELNTIVE